MLAALASWLDARAHGGRWLLRIEDVDAQRCDPRHARSIISALDRLGLHWDGEISYQTQREERYREVMAALRQRGMLFGCVCTRKQLRAAQTGGGEPVYPGTCRDGLPPDTIPRSWRFRVAPDSVTFEDRRLGPQRQCPARQCGDFILRRTDGLFAYQFAVVLDDFDQGVNQIVRGVDLLPSTGRQILLQRALEAPTPTYLHLPLLVNDRGEKLSKQTGAPPIDLDRPEQALQQALAQLGQAPCEGKVSRILDQAVAQWSVSAIPAPRATPEFHPLQDYSG